MGALHHRQLPLLKVLKANHDFIISCDEGVNPNVDKRSCSQSMIFICQKVKLLLLHLALIQLQNHEAASKVLFPLAFVDSKNFFFLWYIRKTTRNLFSGTIPAMQMVPATLWKTKPRVSKRPKISALVLAATLPLRTLQVFLLTIIIIIIIIISIVVTIIIIIIIIWGR